MRAIHKYAFCVQSTVSYLENVFGHVPLVGNAQTRNWQVASVPGPLHVQGHEKQTSRKHLHTKVTPDFHLTYSKNGGNLGSVSK